MKRIIVGAFVVLLLLSVYKPITVTHAQESLDSIEVILDWATWNPTRLTFSYVYTNNHSISDITTLGASLYKHSGGPTSFEFIAEDIDTYSFNVMLAYDNWTSQSILMGLFSGTEAPKGFTVKGGSTLFIIHVRLSVSEQPRYPSESDVAHEVVRQMEQALVQQTEENKRLMSEVQTMQVTSSIFSVIAATTSLITLLVAAALIRERKRRGIGKVEDHELPS